MSELIERLKGIESGYLEYHRRAALRDTRAKLTNDCATIQQAIQALSDKDKRIEEAYSDIQILFANLDNLVEVSGEVYSDEPDDVYMVEEARKRMTARIKAARQSIKDKE